MSDTVYTEDYKGLTIEIVPDDDTESPESDTNLFLVANHRDFYVKPPGNSTMESVAEDHKKTHRIFGLEAYIHSGVVLSLTVEGNFPDRQWDVSQLGAVFVAKEEWKTRAEARKAAIGLIETWNCYLSGSVYGFMVKDENGDVIDSCWGFYESEYQAEKWECLAQARGQAQYYYDSRVKLHLETRKAQIKHHAPLESRKAFSV